MSIYRRTLTALFVFVAIFTLSFLVRDQSFETLSTWSFGSVLKKRTYKSSPAVPVRDYVLNFSRRIKLPVWCVPFSTVRGNIPICVHDNKDEFITKSIIRTGTWEKGHSRSLQKILVANPDYGFIDIGANLGMFSLLAANLQRPVLAVEAMDFNTERFHQSVFINRFEKYITLVTRPLSDKYENIRIHVDTNNLGRSRLTEYWGAHKKIFKGKVLHLNKKTMMLDDLIDLMPWKKAIMVIDVEGNEGRIIRGGQKFFDAIDISHVFMEWNLLSGNDREFLVDFLTGRGYTPYNTTMFSDELDLTTFNRWPVDIFWRK